MIRYRPLLGMLSVLLAGLTLLDGCGAAPVEATSERDDELRTSYGDLAETLAGADRDRWSDIRSRLIAGFDRICSDTMCSGDYANLTTIRLACSSTRTALKMKDCLWLLGGNVDYVDGRTGDLTGDARAFACHVPVGSNAEAFLAALETAGADALDAKIPGTGHSFYDALVTCVSGVVAPLPPPASETDYRELGDALWAEGDAAGLGWLETTRKLARGFDDICGDTFCEGDFADIVALRLACSLDARSQRVGRCVWTFAGAGLDVDARGKLTARTMTKRCDIRLDTTRAALTTALAGESPLQAPLPNRSTSLYDALVDCL